VGVKDLRGKMGASGCGGGCCCIEEPGLCDYWGKGLLGVDEV